MDAMEGQIRKLELETCSQAEFNAEMEAIDEVLRSRNVPIPARELQATQQICMRNGFSLGMHEHIANRMRAWFKARYGSRLGMDMSLGYAPVLIRGDAFRMRIPMLFYGGRIVATTGPTPNPAGPPLVNVCDLVENLPNQIRISLSQAELHMLVDLFVKLKVQLERITSVVSEDGYKTAFGDLSAASDYLTKERFEVGLSRWSTLQFIEKFLKSWLGEKRVKIPKIHLLGKLADMAESHGLPTVNRADIAIVQCSPEVRYDATGLLITDAVEAYFASLRIADHIVSNRARTAAK